MSTAPTALLARHLRRWRLAGSGLSDAQLLERFAASRDEQAFAVLVQRHGPLVRGLCRRLLGNDALSDDVFQMTFLVLARQAGSVRKRASVGSWLYGVAWRLAHKARRSAARRRRHEQQAGVGRQRAGAPDAGWAELLAVLDEELARLPERARAPLLLCYLDGHTQDEAARRMGWSLGTLRRRLDWGRDLLRRRMARRGGTLSAGLFAALLAPAAATAAVPEALVRATAEAAAALTPAAWGSVPRLILISVLVMSAAAGVGGWLYHAGNEERPLPARATDQPPSPEAKAPATEPQDHLNDPLPEGALRRFGSLRFRNPSGINGAALSPDGKTIATISSKKVLRLIDTTTGLARWTVRDVAVAQGYSDGQSPLAFTPDGKGLLTTSGQVFDAVTGKEIKTYPRPVRLPRGGWAQGTAFSPDGKQVAFTIDDAETIFHDADTGKEQHRVGRKGSWLAYAPDSRTVALPGDNLKKVRIVEAATGKEVCALESPADVRAAAFAPDGKILAAACQDNTVRFWHVADGKLVCSGTLEVAEPTKDHPNTLALTLDGKMLAVATTDGVIHLLDPSTGKTLRKLKGHTWWVNGLCFSPDGKLLYSGSWDKTVRRWDAATGKELRLGGDETLDQGRAALSPDGKLLATTGQDGQICLWEAASGRRLHTLRGHGPWVFGLGFSPDGKRLASGGRDMTVRLWDVVAGKELSVRPCERGAADQGRINAVAWSPDGKYIAATDDSKGAVHIWDADTGRVVHELSQKGAAALAFSPDGKSLAVGDWEHKVVVWDVANGKQVRLIDTDQIVDAVAFSPDGKLIATGHHGRPISLWDAGTGDLVRELKHQEEVVWTLRFSPDGQWLASGGTEGTLRLWEVATGKELHRLVGHEFWVMNVAFSPDGRRLLSGGYDGVSYLWGLKPKTEQLAANGVKPLWDALRGDDAGATYRAVWALAEHPEQSVAFLREHLRSARPKVDADRAKQLLADLDSDEFAKREAASRELAMLGAPVEPALREALEKAPSPEVRRRLQALLVGLRRDLSAEELRQLRALRALELMGTAAALDLLRDVAHEAPEGPVARQARGALRRLGR